MWRKDLTSIHSVYVLSVDAQKLVARLDLAACLSRTPARSVRESNHASIVLSATKIQVKLQNAHDRNEEGIAPRNDLLHN